MYRFFKILFYLALGCCVCCNLLMAHAAALMVEDLNTTPYVILAACFGAVLFLVGLLKKHGLLAVLSAVFALFNVVLSYNLFYPASESGFFFNFCFVLAPPVAAFFVWLVSRRRGA